jgi:hypothetical protein
MLKAQANRQMKRMPLNSIIYEMLELLRRCGTQIVLVAMDMTAA